MADGFLNQPSSVPDQELWADLFRRQVAANARFWVEQLAGHPEAIVRAHPERDNIIKALGRSLQLEAAWAPATDLLLAFHPYMERRGVMAEWEQFVEACLEICRRHGDLAAEAALLDRLGELKRDQGAWDEAVTCHLEAYQRYEQLGEGVGRARALGNLGQVYRLQRRFPEARRALEAALDSRGACPNPEVQAFVHTTLGLVQNDEYQHEEAIASYETAYRLWSQTGNLEGMARTRQNLGLAYLALGDWDQAESSFHSAIELYQQTHSRLYLALASMDLGNVYLRRGQHDQAEALYRQAKGVMEQAGYTRGLAQVFNNLGMACTGQEKWRLAEDFFRRSIALWRQLGEPVSQANAEDNLAEAYLLQLKWEDAREVLNQALERLSGLEPVGRVEALLADIDEHLRAVVAGSAKALEA